MEIVFKEVFFNFTSSTKNRKDMIVCKFCPTISNIPTKKYDYVINGKSAIEWIMEHYAITIYKERSIKNTPNDRAAEYKNPYYILDLFLSIITVSMKTADIVDKLPKLDF